MKRKAFGRDAGLTARMFLTGGLLGLLYVVFAVILFEVLNAGLLLMIVIVGGIALLQYFTSDKLALAASGAKVVERDEAPELHAMVERLCALADLPKPRIAVIDTEMPNAFATGRNPKHSAVAVTRGLWDRLDAREIEGVLAHELAHISNRDVAIMTIASFFSMVASYITHIALWSGMGRSRDNGTPVFLIVFLVSILTYVISYVLILALSRYREFAADRGAALITGRPSALASALQRISSGMARIPQQDLRATQELSAFYIFPPGAGKSIAGLFATHPPMEKRIAALQRLEMQLQGTVAA